MADPSMQREKPQQKKNCFFFFYFFFILSTDPIQKVLDMNLPLTSTNRGLMNYRKQGDMPNLLSQLPKQYIFCYQVLLTVSL